MFSYIWYYIGLSAFLLSGWGGSSSTLPSDGGTQYCSSGGAYIPCPDTPQE